MVFPPDLGNVLDMTAEADISQLKKFSQLGETIPARSGPVQVDFNGTVLPSVPRKGLEQQILTLCWWIEPADTGHSPDTIFLRPWQRAFCRDVPGIPHNGCLGKPLPELLLQEL